MLKPDCGELRLTMASWLRRTFSLLSRQSRTTCMLHGAGCETSGQLPAVKTTMKFPQSINTTMTVCGVNLTQVRTYKSPREFPAPSPFKNPGPSRIGYRQKIYDGGPLPKMTEPMKHKPKFNTVDRWSRKRALFGQNDYIDILGDGNLHPAELISAPNYLKAFNGNEMQRLVRMLNFNGWRIRHLYPFRYHQIQKRIRFLYKKYNHKRGKKH